MKSGIPRILIVEDDKLLSFVEERLVKKLGYEVAGKAADGEQAIQYVKQEEPDLIIMDIRLNGTVDGIQAMKEIRKISSIPVIFLTGDSNEETKERINQISNCVNYLVKPVNAADLRVPLKSVFGDAANPSDQEKSANEETSQVA